ncbi:unnamed protein product [Somion occarium]|uniref:Glycoside hydrolase family 76 protein n=1 Tax=Somion occarium TaxID=3059160 RepID=A0ABP1CR59_9APHY
MIPLYDATSRRLKNLTYGQNGHMLSSIALHDLIAGNQDNNAILNFGCIRCPDVASETLSWALAAINAYRAYRRDLFLSTAAAVWNQINDGCVITADDASKGSHPIKTVTLPAQCNGTSVVGGVFLYGTNPTNLGVNIHTIGAFMTLSSLLFEATGNGTYSDSAGQSFEFIRSHLYDGNIIHDRIDLATCMQMDLQSSNSGFVIEGLSVYADTTSNGPASDLLKNLIPSAMKYAQWTGSDGIVFETTSATSTGNKGTYIRGLHEAWSRLDKNSDLAKLIQSYVLVQYNALLDLAKSPSDDFYSPGWEGPQATELLPSGQYFAASVLNSALSMTNNGTVTGSSTDSPSATHSGLASETSALQSHHISTGVIVGATIGGVAFLAVLMAFLVFLFLRQRNPRGRGVFTTAKANQSLDGCYDALEPSEPVAMQVTPYPLTSTTLVSSSLPLIKGSTNSISTPPASSSSRVQEDVNQESIPELLQRLNRAMAQVTGDSPINIPYEKFQPVRH